MDGWHQAHGSETLYEISSGQLVGIKNLADGKDCALSSITGKIKKLEYAPDAITISGFVVEQPQGQRLFVNVDWPQWSSPRFHDISHVDLSWLNSGLRLLLRKDQRIAGDAWVCGTGSFYYLTNIRRAFSKGSVPNVPSENVAPAISSSSKADITVVETLSDGGSVRVPVTINGVLTLNFMIDSGASDVVLPVDVVLTLVRSGTITDTDFLNKQTYELADGSKLPSQQFVIRTLKVKDKVLENVVGSIAPVRGTLLLGQSFLRRFGSWSIDNEKGALILNSAH